MAAKTGRAWVFADDVDTDLIYHNKYLAETDPKQMPQYSFEYYPGMENFAKEVKPGDYVVAGKNFGCGSSREHAVYCLQYAGVPEGSVRSHCGGKDQKRRRTLRGHGDREHRRSDQRT